jgi:ribosomal protein S8
MKSAIFPAMIAAMRGAWRNKKDEVCVPVNELSVKVLRKFRDRGLIIGFSFEYWSGMTKLPRARIFLKYDKMGLPMIREMRVFRKGRSHLFTLKRQKLTDLFLRNSMNYLLTTPQGIFYSDEIIFNNYNTGGILLLRVRF